ncbi:MAG: exodeoxyribonuclease VII large subunit [Bacteroidales bacterium]|jgi:exodeoxyribonuclease VII large subunit|nr:exodeoxyribonuclease VII large subunit [Bacteroidales bacterium]
MPSSLTLLELNRLIKTTVEAKFDAPLWLVAEINSINEHRSGHCYIELVQKANDKDLIIAQARAVIWSNQYRFISSYFQSVTNTKLTKGIKILVKVSVDFHELYGLSLNIRDIDPSYTLGDLEKRKKEIIEKLVSEGVIDMNKSLSLPLVIRNIAIISSSNAAGLEDFVNHLSFNKYGYNFDITLFETDMQGANTESSVINSLNNIFEQHSKFDIVAIIRGGGAKGDLSYFDNYNIAFYITQFPLPVFSGIGHERDDSVTDMVAHTRLKTPTAVADYIIEHTLRFENYISDIYNNIIDKTKDYLKINELYLTNLGFNVYKTKDIITENIEKCNRYYYKFKHAVESKLKSHENKLQIMKGSIARLPAVSFRKYDTSLEIIYEKIQYRTKHYLRSTNDKINIIEQNIKLVDPVNVLKRGYSVSKVNGKVLKNGKELRNGDIMETIVSKDKIVSRIIKEERNE